MNRDYFNGVIDLLDDDVNITQMVRKLSWYYAPAQNEQPREFLESIIKAKLSLHQKLEYGLIDIKNMNGFNGHYELTISYRGQLDSDNMNLLRRYASTINPKSYHNGSLFEIVYEA